MRSKTDALLELAEQVEVDYYADSDSAKLARAVKAAVLKYEQLTEHTRSIHKQEPSEIRSRVLRELDEAHHWMYGVVRAMDAAAFQKEKL